MREGLGGWRGMWGVRGGGRRACLRMRDKIVMIMSIAFRHVDKYGVF